MANPKLRFPSYNDVWECTQVKNIASKIYGGGTPSKIKSDYWKGSLPWVSSSDIKDNDIHNVNITRFITSEAVDNSSTNLYRRIAYLLFHELV